jgi:3-methyladenine DNA glycosylase Tag
MPEGQAPEQITPTSLNDYLEIMSKSVFQTGMSWKVVDSKWPDIKEAFYDFDINKVANLIEPDIDELAQDTRVIRNRRKLEAIVGNAQSMQRLDNEYGTFQNYLRSQGDFDATLKSMRKEFKFMGPTGVYVFLHIVGEEVPSHEEFEATYRK